MKIKFPPKKNKKFIENFFVKKGLKLLVDLSKKKQEIKRLKLINLKPSLEPTPPELGDLYNLYQYVFLNKRVTICEFGSGWSSLVLNLALWDLKKKYQKDVKNLRSSNPFELFVIDDVKRYLNISKKRIEKFNKILKIKKPIKVNFSLSDVEMTVFNDRICNHFKKLPLCNPDFIYLDGPNQFKIKKEINGITIKHPDLMPMNCDLLKFEYFYKPGTIIVCDGRGSNAKFLKDNFKRNWKYYNDKKNDQHIFYLNDPVLGKYNNLWLKFYNK
tara:strand:+ start:1359 stop:2174 length:816 start_codon:yes stop_codon:yes gene_type:complete